MIKLKLQHIIIEALGAMHVTSQMPVQVEYSGDASRGEYSTNIAMVLAKQLGRAPLEIAEEIKAVIEKGNHGEIGKIAVAKPGFINFWVTLDAFKESLNNLTFPTALKTNLSEKKIFIEYAHPNTHKEMHIGHMRTLITGEAVARLAEAAGAKVFRANYQGDIGLHVAKALYGIEKLMEEKNIKLSEVAHWENADKAHFLGQGYALGSADYEKEKETIDKINRDLYTEDSEANKLYIITRSWSLDYYDEFYTRFYTKFDRLFFESEVAQSGLEIVRSHVGTIFEKQNGAIVFPGEKYGLHTRVFITQAGNPTYEGKEMGNAFNEYNAFHFDQKVHVVGNEQAGYFKVVFKALELIDPMKFKDKQYHISMGMVQFSDRKMSSRTGDVLRVDWLIDQVKERVKEIMKGERIPEEKLDDTIEKIAIGAIKYSVLQVGTGQNVAFDINKSVSLEGNSGPYIQYVYARTQSVLRKASNPHQVSLADLKNNTLNEEEKALLLVLDRYSDVVAEAAVRYSPSIVTSYLFELAQAFNLFYQKCPILKEASERKSFRLGLTITTGKVIKHGLYLLGIQAPDQM